MVEATLFVVGFEPEVTQQELNQYFTKAGKVLRVYCKNNYAFITFKKLKYADIAIDKFNNKTYKDGKKLVIEFSNDSRKQIATKGHYRGNYQDKKSISNKFDSHILCFNCNRQGHIRAQCPELRKKIDHPNSRKWKRKISQERSNRHKSNHRKSKSKKKSKRRQSSDSSSSESSDYSSSSQSSSSYNSSRSYSSSYQSDRRHRKKSKKHKKYKSKSKSRNVKMQRKQKRSKSKSKRKSKSKPNKQMKPTAKSKFYYTDQSSSQRYSSQSNQQKQKPKKPDTLNPPNPYLTERQSRYDNSIKDTRTIIESKADSTHPQNSQTKDKPQKVTLNSSMQSK